MASVRTPERPGLGRVQLGARTLRKDRWWVPPLLTVVGLTAWLAYAFVRVFTRDHYWVDGYNYLTPFYSPCVVVACDPHASHFGAFLPAWPLVPFAAVSLPFLLGFRLTCYYYRKAYYRSYWLSPPSCAVSEPHKTYTGETRFPLLFQNVHRYFFYAALVISIVNTYDAGYAMWGDKGLQLGLGNVILWGNVILLWGYTLSCHSCRHIVAGRLNHFSAHPVRYRLWTFVSKLNRRHMELAWITLGTLALTDAYIALVSAGILTDLRFLH